MKIVAVEFISRKSHPVQGEIHPLVITALNYFEYPEDGNISPPENYLAAMCDHSDSVHDTSIALTTT